MFTAIKNKLNHFTAAIFQKAINSERQKAGLRLSSVSLSFGQISYLENSRKDQAETIVMLHGFGADSSAWIRFTKQMGQQRNIVIPDLPGHGASCQNLTLHYGIAQHVAYLREFLDRLQISRIHLFGNSMGAAIALRFAHDYPDTIESLVLIDAAGVETTPSELRELVRLTGRHPLINIRSVAEYTELMRFGMEKPPYIPSPFLQHLAREKSQRAAIELRMFADIEDSLDQTAILKDIHAPGLIIWGAKDRIVHVDDARFLHEQLIDSHLVILDGLGHVPMVENPRLVATHCQTFLNQLAEQGRKKNFA
jgi:abhydrolase domain-containing protein 6